MRIFFTYADNAHQILFVCCGSSASGSIVGAICSFCHIGHAVGWAGVVSQVGVYVFRLEVHVALHGGSFAGFDVFGLVG